MIPRPLKPESRARSPSALEMASGMTGVGENYMDLYSPTTPTTQSMKLRLRKQLSTASSSVANDEIRGRKTVTRVKKTGRRPEERAFRRHIGCAARAAAGVLLAGVLQTGSSASSTGSEFLPSFYYLEGLAYAAIMVIYASAPTVGGVVQQIWQIDLGVGIALLYNFGVFLVIPITQGNLISVPENLNDTPYFVSLHDWGLVSPFMLTFTFVIFLLPIQHNVKKFAVMSNAFFMLKFINPMNPRAGGTALKDLNNSDYVTKGLLKNLAVYSIIDVAGTLICLMTVLYPLRSCNATKKLMRHMGHAPTDIRKILNLIMDSYCFRVKDIKKMDFFRLRLDRLLYAAQHRLSEMEELLDDCWWEEILGVGLCLTFNKNVAKQFVKLYARLLKDLRAMKFAIEAENGHWTHVVLMKRMQQSLHIMQVEANDLLQEIAERVLEASTEMPTPKFTHLEQTVCRFMKKYTKLYGAMLSAEVHTTGDVGKTMSLNVFIYSFHSFVHTLFEFEERLSLKNFSCRYRIAKFFKMNDHVCRAYDAGGIAYCISTFVFAFSATGPTAIAMVAQFHVGGTYGNMRNRMTGLVAGTVVPSILHFFVCKISDVVFYNALNNAVLFIWIVGSMYVCYSSSYLRMAGMVSAYMSASVLLDHSCRKTTKALSYSSLTENSVAILTLMVVEVCLQPQSARGLLRANIQQVLGTYNKVFRRVFAHHITSTDATAPSGTRALHKELSIILPAILKQQKQLVQDATAEPSLWKATFSNEQYTQVPAVCWTLLDRLRLLSDLVEWRERSNKDCVHKGYRLKRRNAGSLNEECTAAFNEQEEERAQHPETVYFTAMAPTTGDLIPEAPLPPLPSNATPAVAKARWDCTRNSRTKQQMTTQFISK
ncbi:uncharacterized protein PITG_06575 [Phytophthora infestans T30-4]|uniref:Transmembrane protein, putative n=1 Tax=Phytophthora infestans (strain T30-4) TaxID=403677 RepID=D0N561_PHYIT|nr:uncharacterized protein PITG_06575 [Phytophthora infestans T30-4]EEY70019.1 transmembrane protein, putative [Phytophthora infestans T30-4]|eukprot:XP_002998666.1 transmembrane protein, putative [Phytophthora infestans T30-4]